MALKFDKYRFYHIPKTGGNYVRKVIRFIPSLAGTEEGHPHCGPLRLWGDGTGFTPHVPGNSFCCVRNPYSWYESFYRYRVQNGWKSDHPLDVNCRASTYDEFIWNMLKIWDSKDSPGYASILYYKHIPFCDHVLRMENLTPQLKSLFKKWGLPFPENVDAENVTNKKIDTKLSPRLRKKLRDIDKDISNYLGYWKL